MTKKCLPDKLTELWQCSWDSNTNTLLYITIIMIMETHYFTLPLE